MVEEGHDSLCNLLDRNFRILMHGMAKSRWKAEILRGEGCDSRLHIILLIIGVHQCPDAVP
jgi:hypothetical protein